MKDLKRKFLKDYNLLNNIRSVILYVKNLITKSLLKYFPTWLYIGLIREKSQSVSLLFFTLRGILVKNIGKKLLQILYFLKGVQPVEENIFHELNKIQSISNKGLTRHYKMTLRYYISLTFFALFILTMTYGQGKEVKNYALFKIKKVCQQINHYKNYKTVTIDDTEEFLGHGTDNGGRLTGFYKGDDLKKVIEWVGLSDKVIQNEYYFDNDKLIFVFSTESRYGFNEKTQSFDYRKLDKFFKGRYYFDKGKLINTLLNDKEHIATKRQDATELMISSKEYLKILKTKLK